MKARTTESYVAIALGTAVAVVLLLWRPAAAEVVYPAERVKLSFSRRVMTRVKGFFRGAEARAENVRLRREVAALALVRDDAERLEAENARLRRAMGYAERMRWQYIAAAVLSSGGGAAGADGRIRVDKGSLAGVVEGAVVIVPEGLVGRVTAVSPHTCEVTLVTEESVKVACEVDAGDGKSLRGILSGGGEDLLLLRHVVGDAEAPPRAPVFTSGKGGVFPRGIAVGFLMSVDKSADGLSREGEVLPSVDYSTLEDVFIRCAK